MELWIKNAKRFAKSEAECTFERLKKFATAEDLDFEWFYEEFMNNMSRLKNDKT